MIVPRLALALFATSAFAFQDSKPAYGASHVFQDWAVACDNTHHCDVTGSQGDDEDEYPVLMIISRDAGPNTPIQAKFVSDSDFKTRVSINAAGFRVNDITFGQPIVSAAVAPLIDALLKTPNARLTDGNNTWTLSTAGMRDALEKMDEWQSRIGTTGAIVRKGAELEDKVPAALAAPAILSVPFVPAHSGDKALAAPILAAISPEDFCEDAVYGKAHAAEARIFRVSNRQVFVVSPCSEWLINHTYGVWLANDKEPYSPSKVLFPLQHGGYWDKPISIITQDGAAGLTITDRVGSDCYRTLNWLWTGNAFALAQEVESPLCKGVLGGYPMFLWRSQH